MIGEPNKGNTINKAPVIPPPPTHHNQFSVNLPITPSSTHTIREKKKKIHLGYILMRLLKALGYFFFFFFPTPLPFPERFKMFCSWLLQNFTKAKRIERILKRYRDPLARKAALAPAASHRTLGISQILSFCNFPRSADSAVFPHRPNPAGSRRVAKGQEILCGHRARLHKNNTETRGTR